MKRKFSREDLVVSCFGLTRVEAHRFISEYQREFDAFLSNENNRAIRESEEYRLLKPFIGKAQTYITYNGHLPVNAVNSYEKELLDELLEKLL